MPIILEAGGTGTSVPGLDATHTWNGGFTLYGPGDESLPPPPYALIRKIDNWRSLPDTTDVAEPADSRWGEVPRSIKRLGKTVGYDGVIVARNPGDLHTLTDELVEAFQPTEADGIMVVDGFFNENTWFYNARPLTLVINEEFTEGPSHTRSGGWERPFVLSLKMHDARFYLSSEVSVESGTTPSTNPLLRPWSWNAPNTNSEANLTGWSNNSVEALVTDTGKANARPVLELHGPTSGSVVAPRVANWTSKTGLRFSEGFQILPGQHLELDFRARTSIVYFSIGGSADVDRLRQADYSDWWDDSVPGLVAGAENQLRYGGKTTGAGMKLVVKFNPSRY